AGAASASRFCGDLHGWAGGDPRVGVSRFWRKPDVVANLRVSIFSGMGSCYLLHCSALYIRGRGRPDRAGGGGLELSELSGGYAVLVQPVLCHVWRSGAAAIPGCPQGAAGVCGGVSILIKVIGAYYIAGALLFLAFLEQSDVQSSAQSDVQNDEPHDHES